MYSRAKSARLADNRLEALVDSVLKSPRVRSIIRRLDRLENAVARLQVKLIATRRRAGDAVARGTTAQRASSPGRRATARTGVVRRVRPAKPKASRRSPGPSTRQTAAGKSAKGRPAPAGPLLGSGRAASKPAEPGERQRTGSDDPGQWRTRQRARSRSRLDTEIFKTEASEGIYADLPTLEDLTTTPRRGRSRSSQLPAAAAPAAAAPATPTTLPARRSRSQDLRWILAQISAADQPSKPLMKRPALQANTKHIVAIEIGPQRRGMTPPKGGAPIDDLLPDRKTKTLHLVFTPPSGHPLKPQSVTLPPSGPTKTRRFQYKTGPSGHLEQAKIEVLYQNRVLQTAIIRTLVVDDPASAPADAKIQFTIAAIRPGMGDLAHRRRFDAAILTSRTPEDQPVAIGVHDGKIARFDNAGLQRSAEAIISILGDLANDPGPFAPPLSREAPAGLLRQLALQGVQLYRSVGVPIESELHGDDLSRLQVLTSNPDDFVPIEFVYDLPAPTLTANLCPNWLQALTDGACDPKHHPPAPGKCISVVCPLGFWGLSKVIERQVADPNRDLRGSTLGVRTEPTSDRAHLVGFTSAILGVSSRADKVRAGSPDVLAALQAITRKNSLAVKTWVAWENAVLQRRPGLQVLIAHTEPTQGTVALEIGDGDSRVVAQINDSLVKPHHDMTPVVLLLGCDTAVANRDLQSFVGAFRDAGAALVVGTIAAILGENASPIAQALIHALGDPYPTRPANITHCFGDTMLAIRRELLSKGELMALCLTSFGDADWQLGVAS